MSRLNINAVRSEALFASELQRSETPTAGQVRDAIRRAVRELGSRGCAARVAQEFGDHPEIAVARMRWACRIVEDSFAGRAHRATRARHAEYRTASRAARAA